MKDETQDQQVSRQDIPSNPMPFGFCDEIHGEQGAPCPDYIPTKHELELLARHWAGVKVDIEDFCAAYEQVGSSDMRQHAYAILRLGRIRKYLGDARIEEIIEEAWKKYPPVVKADEHDAIPDATNT